MCPPPSLHDKKRFGRNNLSYLSEVGDAVTIDVQSILAGIGIGVSLWVIKSQATINKEVVVLSTKFDMMKEGLKNLNDLNEYFRRTRTLEEIIKTRDKGVDL